MAFRSEDGRLLPGMERPFNRFRSAPAGTRVATTSIKALQRGYSVEVHPSASVSGASATND